MALLKEDPLRLFSEWGNIYNIEIEMTSDWKSIKTKLVSFCVFPMRKHILYRKPLKNLQKIGYHQKLSDPINLKYCIIKSRN